MLLTIAADGSLRSDKGYVRAEHEPVTLSHDDEAQEGREAEDRTTEEGSGSTVTPFRLVQGAADKGSAHNLSKTAR